MDRDGTIEGGWGWREGEYEEEVNLLSTLFLDLLSVHALSVSFEENSSLRIERSESDRLVGVREDETDAEEEEEKEKDEEEMTHSMCVCMEKGIEARERWEM